MRTWKTRGIMACCAAAILATTTGCLQRVADDDSSASVVPNAIITIKVINRTTLPLDPEIYIGPIADGKDNLFSDANKESDFGVGNRGVLLPDDEASFYVRCGDEVFVATHGGIFGEDLADPDGAGQELVLEEDVNVRCGDQITFVFDDAGNSLVTAYSVAPRTN